VCSAFSSVLSDSLQQCNLFYTTWSKDQHTDPHCILKIWILSSFLCFSQNKHSTKLVFLLRANVHCVMCQVGSVGWWKWLVFLVWWSVVKAPFPPSFRSLTNANLKFQWDNFEPQELRKIKVLKTERSSRWKKHFLSIFTLSSNGVTLSCSYCCLHTPRFSYSLVLLLALEHFHAYQRNYLLLEDSAYLSVFRFLSFHTVAV
jgi:hypothetical protein